MSDVKFERPVRLIGKHVDGCWALRNMKSGVRSTCWGPLAWGDHGEPVVKTERRYGKNGRRSFHWLRYICNDLACKAELHVNVDYVIHKVQREAKP